MDANRGVYLVLLELERRTLISTGAREWELEPGMYIYVGSAMTSLSERVGRHLKLEKKKHWHIDYLREESRVLAALLLPSDGRMEEELSRFVSKYGEGVKGFGAGDCKVESNLYRIELEAVSEVFYALVKNWRERDDSFFD
jgi:Uri superfamily endonuclease